MLSEFVMTLKVAAFFGTMIYVQAFLLGNTGSESDCAWLDMVFNKSHAKELVNEYEVLLLIFEATVFYASMFALILLMAISRFQEFTPIRDRVNLSSLKKDKTDYLLYRAEDLHYFFILT